MVNKKKKPAKRSTHVKHESERHVKSVIKSAELFYTAMRLNGDLMVYQYGHHECPNAHYYGPSEREYYLFHYIVKGCGIYRTETKEYHLGSGEGFLIKPGETTFYQADEHDPWEYYFVAFHGTIAKAVVAEIEFEDGYIFRADNPETMERSIKSVCKQYPTGSLWSEYKVLGKFYVLLSEMIKEKGVSSSVQQRKQNLSVLNQALSYIKDNISKDDLSVQSVAEYVNLDRTSLYRIFKKKFNVSVVRYLKNYRMDRAAALLSETTLTCREICFRVGMPEYPNFCKSFKAYYGYSPMDYRKTFGTAYKKKRK